MSQISYALKSNDTQGAGAHGYFETTTDIGKKYSMADVFQRVGEKTPLSSEIPLDHLSKYKLTTFFQVRFSTVGGEEGSADVARYAFLFISNAISILTFRPQRSARLFHQVSTSCCGCSVLSLIVLFSLQASYQERDLVSAYVPVLCQLTYPLRLKGLGLSCSEIADSYPN